MQVKHAYVTKRLAPQGYKAVTRPLAQALYEGGYSITLCGNNVNSYHVFDNWCLGCTVSYALYNHKDFNSVLSHYMFYLESELGRYPVFYVKIEDLNTYNKVHKKGRSC